MVCAFCFDDASTLLVCSAPFHGASHAERATCLYWVGMNPNHLTEDELLYELCITGY